MANKAAPQFSGRVALQQRVLPAYRAPFFDQLAQRCGGGLSVFAGEAQPEEAIQLIRDLELASFEKADNFHILRGKGYFCIQRGLIEWLEKFDPDVLILEANPRYLSNLSGVRWMRKRGRSMIGWGLGGPTSSRGIRSLIWRAYLASFDAMLAYSSKGAGRYIQAGMKEERVFVAYNAVTPAPVGDPPNKEPSGRSMRLLFVGRLQKRKRVDVLLHTVSRLEPPPTLTIVGDGPARADLEKVAMQVYPSTEFKGALTGKALQFEFQRADLFALPGTGGLAIQQAMAHGLPIVVAEGDGSQFDLVDSENGWLVQPEGESLYLALQEASSQLDLLPQKGRASFRRVQQSFNIETMADSFIQALNYVVGAD